MFGIKVIDSPVGKLSVSVSHTMKEFLHRNVLLADDDSDDRELFKEAVRVVDQTVRVEVARDGDELMERLKHNAPDLLFLDLNMPRKNGRECLRDIHKDKLLRTIPVIIYTTSLNPLDVEDTFKYGAVHFFRKPSSFEELKEILGRILHSEVLSRQPLKENFVLNGDIKFALKVN
jgi:CheY-like chemotaxis protein